LLSAHVFSPHFSRNKILQFVNVVLKAAKLRVEAMAGSCIIALPSIVSSTWFKQKTCRLRLQGRKAGPWDLEMFFSPVTGSGVGVDGNKQLERGLPFTFQA